MYVYTACTSAYTLAAVTRRYETAETLTSPGPRRGGPAQLVTPQPYCHPARPQPQSHQRKWRSSSKATIDSNRLPCDIARILRSQEAHQRGNFIRLSNTFHGNLARHKIWHPRDHVRVDQPWRYGIDGDFSLSQLHRESTGRNKNPGLGSCVIHLTAVPPQR